ncbi:MAG TPA: hypothetical protein QF564_32230 [Pirellulaceae bacterium]|nr:hypothetical protein [Pirellulaceae bacterium]
MPGRCRAGHFLLIAQVLLLIPQAIRADVTLEAPNWLGVFGRDGWFAGVDHLEAKQ